MIQRGDKKRQPAQDIYLQLSLFHPNDVVRLHELGAYIRSSYAHNLLDDEGAVLETSEDSRTMTVKLPEKKRIHRIVLMEGLRFSQRVERFVIDVGENGTWVAAASGGVIGHKRIIVLEPVVTDMVRIRITDVRVKPVMRFVGLYE